MILFSAYVIFCSFDLGGCINIKTPHPPMNFKDCQKTAEEYHPTKYINKGSLPSSLWRFNNICKKVN